MARNIDLTGKLGLEPRPTITIGDVTLTVDNSATNMLRILNEIGDGITEVKTVLAVSELVFDPKSRKALDKLGLSFQDFSTVVSEAVGLIVGGGDEGNAGTPVTA